MCRVNAVKEKTLKETGCEWLVIIIHTCNLFP
jgi:hypothetical protein